MQILQSFQSVAALVDVFVSMVFCMCCVRMCVALIDGVNVFLYLYTFVGLPSNYLLIMLFRIAWFGAKL